MPRKNLKNILYYIILNLPYRKEVVHRANRMPNLN